MTDRAADDGVGDTTTNHQRRALAAALAATATAAAMAEAKARMHILAQGIPEYAKIIGIDHEPAFNWWVLHILKKREHIISLVKKQNPRYLKRTHKFGIEMPKTVKEALELDKKNGNTLWADTIAKEMKDVRVAFKILVDGQSAPMG